MDEKSLSEKREKAYKILLSIAFGLLGFYCNFHTIIFPLGNYTVAVLFGLLFPLLISLSWGWKYGLLSALSGGSQSMWWLWGPSNGYAIFFVAPPFTLWIVWHGIFAGLRRKSETQRKWWLNMYLLEIPFRVLCTINLLTLSRWAISLNPPPWYWAAGSVNTAPMSFSIFVAIKQACVAYALLICADVLLNINFIKTFFLLKPAEDQRRTGYVVSVFLLLGCLFWFMDALFQTFTTQGDRSFVDLFALDIPQSSLFTRIVFLIFCMISGVVTSRILRRQREHETALKKAREEAVTRENFLRSLIRSIPDLIWLKDPKGIYLACNSRVESLFGAKEKDIIGKTDYDLVNRELADFFRENDKAAMARGRPRTNEEEVTFADDGHKELLETTKTPLYNTDGQLTGVLGIGRDITERVTLQTQLIHAQKMESVGRLAGGVAHDFNNMLSVILGNSELMREYLPEKSPLEEYLKQIQQAAERSGALTRQLLAFARKQTISPKMININEAVESILKMLRRLIGEDIDLEWFPGKDLWPVKVDPAQMDQILANLCVNAKDSINDIGTVTIRTENIILDREWCSRNKGVIPGGYVMIKVSDTGRGMSLEVQEHIFEPFYTTKSPGKGTGLGLATVYGIMKQNLGFIDVHSEPGKGSVFRIFFPRGSGKHQEKTGSASEKINAAGSETVLLVEDEKAILKTTTKMLNRLGYRVIACHCPEDALENIRENEQIDLLMTDVIMPEMNGRDLAQIITEAYPGIKCLFMSGYTADVIAHHGVLNDGLEFISKPFSKNDLAVKLREVLDQ